MQVMPAHRRRSRQKKYFSLSPQGPRHGRTGKTVREYQALKAADNQARNWGYLAATNGLLFGSCAKDARNSDTFFALNPKTGGLVWRYDGAGQVPDTTVSIADYIAGVDPQSRRAFLRGAYG